MSSIEGPYETHPIRRICGSMYSSPLFQKTGHVCSRKQIALEMDIPYEFLGKIAQNLARHGIMEIVRGGQGRVPSFTLPR